MKAFGTSDSAVPSTVPSTWAAANGVFLRHPSAAVPAAGIVALAACRLQQQPLTVLDGAVAASVGALWLVQEWVVHKWLLHSSWEWAGKTIHTQHHEQPYHHISLDPPGLVIGVMLLAAGVFAALLQPLSPLWLTATASYWAAGLTYEWLHYIVHTRWVPPPGWRGAWLRGVRRHHMLHHMRNEDYWLSFSAPAVDGLFGTLPARSTSVPLTRMARIAHGAAAAATPARHDEGGSRAGGSGGSSSSKGGSSPSSQAAGAARVTGSSSSSRMAGAAEAAAASTAAPARR